jgi:hypothetical protein
MSPISKSERTILQQRHISLLPASCRLAHSKFNLNKKTFSRAKLSRLTIFSENSEEIFTLDEPRKHKALAPRCPVRIYCGLISANLILQGEET